MYTGTGICFARSRLYNLTLRDTNISLTIERTREDLFTNFYITLIFCYKRVIPTWPTYFTVSNCPVYTRIFFDKKIHPLCSY